MAMKAKKSRGNENNLTDCPPNCPATTLSSMLIVTPKVTPIAIPVTPPIKPTTTDSETNRYFTSLGEAPMVRIIPISLVRSSKVTVIVLNTGKKQTRCSLF